MYLEGRDGAVKVSMEDAAGIRLNSSSSLSFTADGKICLQGKRISMTAPVEIVCKIPDSNIELCRDLNFYASGGVRTTGTGKLREEAPEKEKSSGRTGPVPGRYPGPQFVQYRPQICQKQIKIQRLICMPQGAFRKWQKDLRYPLCLRLWLEKKRASAAIRRYFIPWRIIR